MEGVFDFEQGYVNITVTGDDDVNSAIVRYIVFNIGIAWPF
jgi:hypothetical protein